MSAEQAELTKTVWILNHYAQEPGGPGGTRHYSLARRLEEHGWKACILAASAELNTERQRLKEGESCRLDNHSGVHFLWLKTPLTKGRERQRALNMLAYTARALVPSCTRMLPKPDVVIGSSVHPFAAWAAAILARRHRVPFVLEVRDLWPQTLVDMGKLSDRGFATAILRRLERWLYLRSNKIIVLLPKAEEYIAPLGVPSSKIVWIPNGIDSALFPAFPLEEKDVFTFMYFGAHGNANGLDNVLKAMAVLAERNTLHRWKARFIGDGPLKAALMRQAEDLHLHGRVFFEDPLPKKDIPKIASEADAFVFNLIDAPVFKYGISSNKLFDFMAAARPIIFCCSSSNNPVAEGDAGITVEPGRPELLANALAEVMSLPREKRVQMGRAGRRHVEANYDHGKLARKLADLLDEVRGG